LVEAPRLPGCYEATPPRADNVRRAALVRTESCRAEDALKRWHIWVTRTLAVLVLSRLGFEGLTSSCFAFAQVSAAEDRSRWIDAYVEGSRALEAGDLVQAKHQLDLALSLAPENPATLHQNAALAARRGESDAAIGLLEQAVARGLDDAALLEWDPDLVTLDADPRFLAILDRARRAVDPERIRSVPPTPPPSRLDGWCVAIARDGTRAAMGGYDFSTVVDLERGTILAHFPHEGHDARRIEFSADGTRLGIETRESSSFAAPPTTFVLDIAKRRRVSASTAELARNPEFGPLPLDRFERVYASEGNRTDLEIREPSSDTVLARVEDVGPEGDLSFLASADASALLIRCWGRSTVVAVDLRTGVTTIPITDSPEILALGFLGTSRCFVAIRPNGRAEIHDFDRPDRRESRSFEQAPLPAGRKAPSVRFEVRSDETGRTLAVLRDFFDVTVFDASDGRRLWGVAADHRSISAARIRGDGLLVGFTTGELALHDLRTGSRRCGCLPPIAESAAADPMAPSVPTARIQQNGTVVREGDDPKRALQIDGEPLCVATFGGETWVGIHPAKISIFESGAETAAARLDLHDLDALDTVSVGTINFSPDGSIAVVGTIGFGIVAAYDRASRRLLWSYEYDGGNGSALQSRFAPDGSWVAIFGQTFSTSRIVETRTGRLVLDLRDRRIYALHPTTDPHRVVALGERGIELLDIPSGQVRSAHFDLTGGGRIEHVLAGFVFADAASLARVHRFVGTGSDDLATLAPYLLDHKKIRAAAAGVAITPPFLPE